MIKNIKEVKFTTNMAMPVVEMRFGDIPPEDFHPLRRICFVTFMDGSVFQFDMTEDRPFTGSTEHDMISYAIEHMKKIMGLKEQQ